MNETIKTKFNWARLVWIRPMERDESWDADLKNKKQIHRGWHLHNPGNEQRIQDGTRSEMRIWDRRREQWMRDEIHTTGRPGRLQYDYDEVPFLFCRFLKQRKLENSWLVICNNGSRLTFVVVSWMKTHGPESIQKNMKSARNKTITAKDRKEQS